jgi:hypothetical protein
LFAPTCNPVISSPLLCVLTTIACLPFNAHRSIVDKVSLGRRPGLAGIPVHEIPDVNS